MPRYPLPICRCATRRLRYEARAVLLARHEGYRVHHARRQLPRVLTRAQQLEFIEFSSTACFRFACRHAKRVWRAPMCTLFSSQEAAWRHGAFFIVLPPSLCVFFLTAIYLRFLATNDCVRNRQASGAYNPKKLMGVTTLDVVRAKTFVAEHQGKCSLKVSRDVLGTRDNLPLRGNMVIRTQCCV